jgi:hypothetical protein
MSQKERQYEMQHKTQTFSVKENFTGCIFTHVTQVGASRIKLIIF